MSPPSKETLNLLRHLVRTQSAGLSWLEALQMWHDSSTHARQRRHARELLVRMRQGQSLSHALAHAGHLCGAALTLSRVAERNGIWATQMGDWLQQREQDAQWRRQVRSALAYPAGVLLLALMVMAGVITWVLPTFEAFYGQLQSELPVPTRWLLEARQFIWAWGDGLALAVLALSLGVAWGVRRPAGAKLWDAWHWRLPGLGHWRQMRVESSWCRLIAQWVEAGLDWDQALAMASAAVDSPVMVQAGAAIRQRLASGQSLGQALAACPHPDGRRALFSPMLTQWVQAGEATGTVCPLLRQWARLQHERLSEQWQLACRLLEPSLMGLLGLLMGWLVLALYVPVLQLGHLM